MGPPEVDGVSLEVDPMHVGVSAHPNEVPGHALPSAHLQAWLVAIHVAVDSWLVGEGEGAE